MSHAPTQTLPGEFTRPRAMPRIENGVRLGLFVANLRNAHYITAAEGSTEPTYENVRRIAITGDEVGLSFLLPVARWKGLKGDHADFCPYGMETITLTSALLEATSRTAVLTTLHTELFSPAIAAKIGATMDQIGDGRWGLNVVAGWSQADFESMGFRLRGHSDRYEHATHWLRAVRELWSEGVSSYTCEYFELNGAECLPRPRQQGGPLVVNAGQSERGMQFAIDNADYLFSTSADAELFRRVKTELGGENVGVIGRKHVIIRPTRAEAEEVAERIVAGGDTKAIAQLLAHGKGPVEEAERKLSQPGALERFLLQEPALGDPQEVAVALAEWSASASIDGICLSLFEQQESLELMDDRFMERLGNELDARGKSLVLP
jgi:alkanesulfonate monooxygenase SsuD/methylene tetrahydromethanopterin reductase-like flavin-dependent oxidoreductase (luciferase family)